MTSPWPEFHQKYERSTERKLRKLFLFCFIFVNPYLRISFPMIFRESGRDGKKEWGERERQTSM